jgi:diguanylate cyclase (GGDEF)-like protein/PAS domain S-box-containing protein
MSTFFQGQMDYIFFFYGLAFIGLGVVAYILSKAVHQRLPWGWLALFGFTHGLNEWLDLMALVGGDGIWFGGLRWAIMAASFICLVEFVRLSLTQRRGQGPGRWLLVVLALAAGLGALDGWSGLNATTRYFLGLVGSLGAGWALFAEARQADSPCRLSLLAGGIGFILYGLATGIVVPQAGFWPAAAVNYKTFTNLTGLPIQLVRGLLAVWIAAMSVGYFQVAQSEEHEPCHRYRARYLYVVVAALAFILAGGWYLTQSLGDLAWQQVRKDSLAHNKLAIQHLIFEVQEAEEAVRAMSGSPWIAPAIRSGTPETLAQAHAVLDRYQQRFGAAVAYLMDASGTTIASSNRGDPDSFVGQKYTFRPYFQAAMAGNAGHHFALGVTSKKRGFYVSHPVVDPTGTVIGVAVFKMTLNRFQQELGEFDPAFLIDPQGIVFVASRPDLDYHSLWPIAVTDPTGFKGQYGTDRFTPIFSQPLIDEARVEFAGKRYVVARQNIAEVMAPDWALVNLASYGSIVHYRLMGIAAAFILVFLTLVFAGTNLSIREGANRIMASEARFRTMFAAAPEAVYVLNLSSRRILGANPFMAQWLGYHPEELVGLEIDKLLEPEPPEAVEEGTGVGPNSQTGAEARRYRKKDGSLVDVEYTEANILHGDHTRKIVFVRDITARRQAENEVRQAKEYLENILENSADPIGIVDQRGRIIKWNKAAEQAFGYSFSELEGNSSFELYADRDQLQTMLNQLRRDGSIHGYEIYLKKKDGSIVPFALSINLLYDRHHKAMGSVCVARNLSEIRKALDDLATVNQQLQHEVTERKQAEVELAWDARVNASISDLSRALLNSLPLEDIAGLVHQHAKNLTDSAQAFCGYINPHTGALVLPSVGQEACGIEEKKVVFHKFAGLWGWVLEHGQSLLTNNPSEDPRAAGTPPGHFPVTRFLSAPAIIDGKLVGQIGLANAPRDYTARDQEICERLARLFAMAIHRHRLDETLKESESGLKTILDNVQTGMLIIDPENHVIVDANPVAISLIGAPKEEIVGSECSRFICRPEHGQCAITDRGETVVNAERELRRPDGTTRWVMQTVVPVSLHGKGRLLESYVDISERKLSEETLSHNFNELQETMQRLEHSKNMLQLIIESVPARVFWKDSDLRYIGCNTLFARDAGFSHPQQLLGKDDFSMGWKEQADLYRTDDRQVIESRRAKINIPEPQTTPTGATIWLNTSKVPLQMPNGEVFGILGVYEDITERRQWEEAIQTTNDKLHALVAQVEERNRTMTLTNEMADMLQACQASEEAYKSIEHFMPRLFPGDAGALYMLNNSRNLFETVASWGQDPLAVSVFAPDECWSVRRGQLHKVENPREALRCHHVAEAVPGGYLCVPLIAQGETLGMFHLRPGPPPEAQTPALAAIKDQLALTVAEDLALALANLRLRETLRNQAIRDPLTGLFNRRYLEETMERELNRVNRMGLPLGVIMMDLDHFKQYNDAFGHSAGDELLSALGMLLKSHIRGEDIACRYGGEEFLLVLSGASISIALERAESLRLTVKEMHKRYQGLKPTTLSLGVAVFPDHGDTGLQLIQAADAALYRAKKAGRDRVMIAEYAEEIITSALPALPLHRMKLS